MSLRGSLGVGTVLAGLPPSRISVVSGPQAKVFLGRQPMKLYRDTRLEIGARVEEIDRDDTDPIEMAGDPNQSLRVYTAVISYYLRQHQMKIQVAGYHVQEIENRTATGADATYPDDQILAQITYRAE